MASSSVATTTPASSAPPPAAGMSPQPPSASPPSSSTSPLSASQLLEMYASAPEPAKAALDHAITDRNALSSQNAQLWKLIEKQRSGYGQILRDLERVRAERDFYRQKINTVSDKDKDKDPNKRHREKPPDNDSYDSSINATPKLGKPLSDDPAPQSSSSTSSSMHHMLEGNRLESTSSLGSSLQQHSSTAPSTPVHNRVQATQRAGTTLSPANVASPARSGSLPASMIKSGLGDNFSPKKPSAGDSTRLVANGSSGEHDQTNNTVPRHPEQTSRTSSQLPTFAQLGYNNIVTGGITQPKPDSGHNSEPFVQSPESQGSSPGIQQKKLSPQLPFTMRALSRESRISLPDEARQYIVNMTDSPMTSPQLAGSSSSPSSTASDSTSSKPSNRDILPITTGVTKLNVDVANSHQANDNLAAEPPFGPPPSQPAHGPPPPLVTIEPATAAKPNFSNTSSTRAAPNDVTSDGGGTGAGLETALGSMFLDMGEDASLESDSASRISQESARSPPAHPTKQPMETEAERKPKSHATVEDFPLPPTSASIPAQAQAYADVQQLLGDNPHAGSASSSQSHLASGAASLASSTSQLVVPSSTTAASISSSSSAASNIPSMSSSTSTVPVNDRFLDAALRPAEFRALPLLPSDLPSTTVTVTSSFVRPNDRGKEVLSFVILVNPRGKDSTSQTGKGKGKEAWNIEKMYSDVLSLDSRVRASVGKGVGKRIAALPEGRLWKDHAPAKVDQRKAVLETYLQMLVQLPIKHNDEVIAFLTSDIVREAKKPVLQAGHKEGYLTKRGKNFGGWKTRFFVLQGPVLEYYDCRGGTHLGSITVTGAQIGRQQRSDQRAPISDEEKEYRHAFLIVEAKKGPGGNHPRHVLCAESDEERDAWVEILVRYFTGVYTEDGGPYNNAIRGPSPIPGPNQLTPAQVYQEQQTRMLQAATVAPRSSSSIDLASAGKRSMTKEDINVSRGAPVPISHLPPDGANAKLYQAAPVVANPEPAPSPAKSSKGPSPVDRSLPNGVPFSDAQTAKRILERNTGLSTSLPDSSSSSAPAGSTPDISSSASPARSNSEMGHYSDMERHRAHRQHSPETPRRERDTDSRQRLQPPGASERIPSPDKMDRVKISGPMNGAPIPAGYKFGGKDMGPPETPSSSDRREKARSRWFTGFSRPTAQQPINQSPPRAVFGVPLEDSLDVAQIANLPAIVFRAIQYLEAKKADQEEGIYRLSGSSAVIKSLKDRFNAEGDVDLLTSDEFWDPHAIAGLLKSFLRELPASILTRDLHLKFLAVIDFVDAQERIKELSYLIASLPLANYSLLRALTAHLILIVENSGVNKMTMRNVGIVFSPTLGIPAGVFSLMLSEFSRVFNVDVDNDGEETAASAAKRTGQGAEHMEMERRNSKQYSDAAADQLLGLAGRKLTAPAEEAQSDGDDFSMQDESGTETTEGDATVESSVGTSPGPGSQTHQPHQGDTPNTPTPSKPSKASNTAAIRGLNLKISTSDRGHRHSRMIGLPTSPRPPVSPRREGAPSPEKPPQI